MSGILKMMKADLAEKQQAVNAYDWKFRRSQWYGMEPAEVMERECISAQTVILEKYIAEIECTMSKNLQEELGE